MARVISYKSQKSLYDSCTATLTLENLNDHSVTVAEAGQGRGEANHSRTLEERWHFQNPENIRPI